MKTSKLVLGTLVLATAALPAHAQQMLEAGTQHQAANSQMAMVAPTARPMATAAFAPRIEISTNAALVASLPMTRNVNPALISIKRAPMFEAHTVYQYPQHAPVPVKTNVFPSAKYVGPSVRFQLTMGTFAAPNYSTPSVPFPIIAPASFPLPKFVAPSVKAHISAAGFPLPNYIGPTVKYQVTSAGFSAPNYAAPSVRFQVSNAGFAAPNYVAPAVKFQVTNAGFAAPSYVAPAVKFQITDAGFDAPKSVSPSMTLQIASADFPMPDRAGVSMEEGK
ncbi:MAG: hypothetical protein WB795_09080 [Candidatus Acidiferrales bacterium]